MRMHDRIQLIYNKLPGYSHSYAYYIATHDIGNAYNYIAS